MHQLVEIFASLQGEGRNAGRPVVFVRFAGCNLACPWCDTDVRPRFTLSTKEIVSEVRSHRLKSVILTGGEPTIQPRMDGLVNALKRAGMWIGVETNGLASPGWLGRVDYVACSPKFEYFKRYVEPGCGGDAPLDRANEVRIVASSPEVVSFARAMKALIKADDYYISPCDRGGDIDFATAKQVLSSLEGFSLSVQLHKILGFR